MPDFKIPSKSYCSYSGPWIEESFDAYWSSNATKTARSYIPVYWTGYLQRARYDVRDLNAYLASLDKDRPYFAVIQHSVERLLGSTVRTKELLVSNCSRPVMLPANTFIFSAGGDPGGEGNIAIPLLKEDLSPRLKDRARLITASFMGKLDGPNDRFGTRRKMDSVFRKANGKRGLSYYQGFGTLDEFCRVTNHSLFCLCPRGFGPTSFRLYEAMALGSIPVYIWKQYKWLPYSELLNWDDLIVAVEEGEIESLPERLLSMPMTEIRRRQQEIRRLYPLYFTMDSVCRFIGSALSKGGTAICDCTRT